MKDAFGYELQVGDIVASTSYYSTLELWIVLSFTTQMVNVQRWYRDGKRGAKTRKYPDTMAIGKPL